MSDTPKTEASGPSVIEAHFIMGVPAPSGLPAPTLPEITFIGRTNAGKSSLINRLTNRKSLARTSRTPGRTQELNLFSVTLRSADDERINYHLVDLPGYGYSKFSAKRRHLLERSVVDYISERESLRAVCLLTDIRRLPEAEELAVRDIVEERGLPLIVLATKSDKLSGNERPRQLAKIAEVLHLFPAQIEITGTTVPAHRTWGRILRELAQTD
jgi:GTP-binding protein